MSRTDADIAILGGGCAGLSLGRRLADARTRSRIVILEPREHYADDRSWCFWAEHDHADARLTSQTWPRWRFSTRSGRTAIHDAPGLGYHYIRGRDFYDDACARIQAHDAVRLQTGVRVRGVTDTSCGYVIETSEGGLTASAVIDTRPTENTAQALMYQCFLGAEIIHPARRPEDADIAGLMEQMDHDADGFHFLYVLPLTPDRSLIEVTRFSKLRIQPSTLEAELSAAIIDRHGDATDRVRTEAGILPMGLAPAASPAAGPDHVFAGLPGGALRPASGYAFKRIQVWADACARSILTGQGVIGHPPEPALRALMDRIFLQALRNHPERGPDFFMAMADRLRPDAFVRFMSDMATPPDLMTVVTALPPAPFLKAALALASGGRGAT